MSDPIERLKARWLADGLTLRPGASAEALDAFEARYQVIMPPSVRAFFSGVDGMTVDLDGEDWPWDRDAYRFWGLPTLLSVRDFWTYHRGGAPDGHDPPSWIDRWFPFADYLINSHAYAVRLTHDPADGGQVCLWDFAEGRHRVATNFEGFLEIYLAGTNEILGGGIEPKD